MYHLYCFILVFHVNLMTSNQIWTLWGQGDHMCLYVGLHIFMPHMLTSSFKMPATKCCKTNVLLKSDYSRKL